MAIDLVPLRHGMRSGRSRELTAATNRRLRARELDAYVVAESTTTSLAVIEAVAKAAWALGARRETVERMRGERVIPVGVQRMIRNPGRRTDRQKVIGTRRIARMRAERKRREEEKRRGSARARAVNAFVAKVGTTERPPGSNGGGIITLMQTYWGFGRVPWCGIACGYHAERFGGVTALRSDVASVAAIEDHARAQHAGYARWQGGPQGAHQGAFVVIGGRGVHVGMLIRPLSGGRAKTVEGNTSFGPGGSQSDGGAIAIRTRSATEIHGVATMDYPESAGPAKIGLIPSTDATQWVPSDELLAEDPIAQQMVDMARERPDLEEAGIVLPDDPGDDTTEAEATWLLADTEDDDADLDREESVPTEDDETIEDDDPGDDIGEL